MTSCPKCSSHRIHGPFYRQGRYGGECLSYTCARCGYTETAPTHDDAKASQTIADVICNGWR